MGLADIDKRGLVLRTAIAPPVWRGAPWLAQAPLPCAEPAVYVLRTVLRAETCRT